MMKTVLTLLAILSFNLLVGQPVKIIFDTDMDSDVDDAGALAVLHQLANKGEVEILGTMSSTLNPWTAQTIDVINTYFERPDLPIGNVQTYGVYRKSLYVKPLAESYPHDTSFGEDMPDACVEYRRLLREQPDTSVVLVVVGYQTNLANLLRSQPDEYSALSGMDLVSRKVKKLVCAGGRYPYEQNPGKFGNFKPDPPSSIYVHAEWPTEIIYITCGTMAKSILTGKIFYTNRSGKEDPVGEAYRIFLKDWKKKVRHSCDHIAVYVAVRGAEPYFNLVKDGTWHFFEDGTHAWRITEEKPEHRIIYELKEGADPGDIAILFDELMIKSK